MNVTYKVKFAVFSSRPRFEALWTGKRVTHFHQVCLHRNYASTLLFHPHFLCCRKELLNGKMIEVLKIKPQFNIVNIVLLSVLLAT